MEEMHEKVLPQIRLVLPPGATEQDAARAASEMISNVLAIEYFEILNIELIEAGPMETPFGMRMAKKFLIAYRELSKQEAGEVVYVHPDYDRLVKS